MTSDWCDDKILMISANLLWIWLHDDDLAIFDNMLGAASRDTNELELDRLLDIAFPNRWYSRKLERISVLAKLFSGIKLDEYRSR